MTRRVLVTGATGFVGQALVPSLAAGGWTVRAATRAGATVQGAAEAVALGDLATLAMRPEDAHRAVDGCDAVIHGAGLAHQDQALGEAIYRAINTEATVALAKAARDSGARFVFVSSIRAQVGPSCPSVINETTPPAPVDAYGRSKLAAEQALDAIEDLDAISVRPVLVHGPGAKGNLASLARIASWPIPWPVASLRAARSVVARADLAAALELLIDRPAPAHRLYIAADPQPISLARMLALTAQARGVRSWQWPFPPTLLKMSLTALGKADLFSRIAEPLVASPARLLKEGWRPRYHFGDASEY